MKEKEIPYLLFIFAEFKEGSTILKELPLQLTPVISSKYIKYNHGNSNVICNFESKLPFNDLREFIDSVLGPIVNQWYLIEHTDNMAVHIDSNLKLNLFDLKSENKIHDKLSDKQGDDELYKVMDYFLTESMKNIDPKELDQLFMDDREDSLIAKLKLKKNNLFSKPTLNSLLEKIKEKGIEKLTKYEKQILDEYARN